MQILYVEDNDEQRKSTAKLLHKMGFNVIDTGNPLEAVGIAKDNKIDIVISDFRMGEMNGYELLQEVKKINPFIKFIITTASKDIDIAVKTMKGGADDYFTKPFSANKLAKALRVFEMDIDSDNQIEVINDIDTDPNLEYPNIIGESKALRSVLSKIPKIAKTEMPVLILGESGTGKELIAGLIHTLSRRKDNTFNIINCAAIPHDLVESELFGYEKGAFTGANTNKKGRIESADKGTIFLDEIGELPYQVQSKLLRFLQNSEVQRVGSIKPLNVDVRVICATNRNIEEMVKKNEFREDLYFRLNTAVLRVPSLKERKEDIPLLVDYFMDKYSEKNKVDKKTFHSVAMDKLLKYDYPGNIRELENIVQYASSISISNVIHEEELPIMLGEKVKDKIDNEKSYIIPKYPVSLKDYIEKIEKDLVMEALVRNNWNQSKAAQQLDISEFSLRYKMKKYSIKRPQ